MADDDWEIEVTREITCTETTVVRIPRNVTGDMDHALNLARDYVAAAEGAAQPVTWKVSTYKAKRSPVLTANQAMPF